MSYLTTTNAARDNCKKIVDGLQNPVTPGINATITIDDCDANSALIQGEFNYEALEFVSNDIASQVVIIHYFMYL